ncbi:restriction endonuclease subunit S [Haliovirga abyssi]|uniref:Restriction endonuclease type I, S subunit n=1 Tax=Haliovirga abyssi TaxID=2996794 RepID=A0AAU9DGF9_9FUSO|nr:restriction endonuclease subunit S [Haliovirga abyssi]BDU51572.1 restriction endonuclease type I, S subunit [Haliovirga abyssi]
MAKKNKEKKSIDELLKEALIPEEEQPYELPGNWAWVRLGNIINLISGQDVSKKLCNENKIGIPYIMGASNMENDNLLIERWIEKPKIIANKGDIILSVKGTVGKLLILKEEKANLSRQVMGIKLKNDIDNIFIYRFFQSYIEELKTRAKGLIPGINRDDILEIKFQLPPLAEQKRIVAKLEDMLSKIKQAKELITEAKETFELRRASILHKAFTGELTKKWREENETESVDKLLKKINEEKLKKWEEKYKIAEKEGKRKPKKPEIKSVEEMKVYGSDQPYELPDGWCWVMLGDITEFKNGYAFKSKFFTQEGLQVIRMGNLYQNSLNLDRNPVFMPLSLDEKIVNKTKLKENDILLTLTGTKYKKDYGYAIKINNLGERMLLLNQRILGITTIDEINTFIFRYLYSNIFRDKFFSFETGGVNQGNVSSTATATIGVPFPSLKEQTEIIRQLEQFFRTEEEAKDLLEMEEQIDLLEKSILSKAFRGELGTNNPDDEPAIELLKRVLQEMSCEN